MLHVNKNADRFSLWGFFPWRRYLQLCILISKWSNPAPTAVSGKTHLIKWKQDPMLTVKYEREKFIPSQCWDEDPFPKKSFSSMRVLVTGVPEKVLPLTFCYTQTITKHNICLRRLPICISSCWYSKLAGKESLRAKHNWWDSLLQKRTVKEWAKFTSNLGILISA